jgi:hypothetical protein
MMSDLVERSRRRFLGLVAAGSAAAAAAPAAALARAVTPKKKPAKPAPGAAGAKPAGPRAGLGAPPAVAEEIRRQKIALEQSLHALRDYPLPPGSEPAFRFAPFRPRKDAGTP